MQTNDAMIAAFADHEAAEVAVKKLAQASFDMKQLSIVGKGFHSEERVIGFYNIGDRMKFWGTQGAFWGGLWGLFLGGVFITAPAVGPVIVLGYLASSIIAAMEGAVVAGSISALAGALVMIASPMAGGRPGCRRTYPFAQFANVVVGTPRKRAPSE